jgi:hypothetical protein
MSAISALKSMDRSKALAAQKAAESTQHIPQQPKERHCSCGCEDFSTGDTCCYSQDDDCFLSC